MSNGQNVCFLCRLSFKRGATCPSCGGDLTYMGNKFKAPRRGNVLQWRKVQLMTEAVWRYRQRSKDCHVAYCSMGCNPHPFDAVRRGILPQWGRASRTLADVKTHLGQRRNESKVYA